MFTIPPRAVAFSLREQQQQITQIAKELSWELNFSPSNLPFDERPELLAMRGVISIYSYSEAALYKSKNLITHQAMLRFCGYGFLLLYYEIVPPSGVALVLPEVRHTYHRLIPRRRTCS